MPGAFSSGFDSGFDVGTNARVSRLSQESLRSGDPQPQISRLSQESLRSGAPDAQLSRLSVEVIRSTVQVTQTQTHTTDVLLRQTFAHFHTTDAQIGAIPEIVHSTDTLLSQRVVQTFTTDARLTGPSTKIHSTDAVLKALYPLPFTDNWTGANSSPWDQTKWATSQIGSGVVDIVSNEGRFHGNESGFYGRAIGQHVTALNVEVLFKMRFMGSGGQRFNVTLRGDGTWGTGLDGSFQPTNGYVLEKQQNSSSASFRKLTGGVVTNIGTSFSWSSGTGTRWCRFQVSNEGGTTWLRAKVWSDGASEPATWTGQREDTGTAPGVGVLQLSFHRSTGTAVFFDDLNLHLIAQRFTVGHQTDVFLFEPAHGSVSHGTDLVVAPAPGTQVHKTDVFVGESISFTGTIHFELHVTIAQETTTPAAPVLRNQGHPTAGTAGNEAGEYMTTNFRKQIRITRR